MTKCGECGLGPRPPAGLSAWPNRHVRNWWAEHTDQACEAAQVSNNLHRRLVEVTVALKSAEDYIQPLDPDLAEALQKTRERHGATK